MSIHSDTFSIKRYIIDSYPQFIEPIESILWPIWETGEDIPDGKNVIGCDFYRLSMTLANLDGNFCTQELDFMRDIKQIFFEDEDDLNDISSQQLLNIYKSTFEKYRSMYEEIKNTWCNTLSGHL